MTKILFELTEFDPKILKSPNMVTGTKAIPPAMYQDVLGQHDRLMGHFDPLMGQHYTTVKNYSASSRMVNGHLLSVLGHHDKISGWFYNEGNAEEAGKMHEDLESMFSKTTGLPERTHVFSGIKPDDRSMWGTLKIGSTVRNPLWTSTSINHHVASMFSEMQYPVDPKTGEEDMAADKVDKHIVHFDLPQGYRNGVYIAGISKHPDEREMVLRHGQSWTVNAIHRPSIYDPSTELTARLHVYSLTPKDS